MNGSHVPGTPDKGWFLKLGILSFQTATGAPPNAAKRSYIRERDDSDDPSYRHAIYLTFTTKIRVTLLLRRRWQAIHHPIPSGCIQWDGSLRTEIVNENSQ